MTLERSLRISEVARILSRGRKRVLEMAHRGEFPRAYWDGGEMRIPERDVERWREKQTRVIEASPVNPKRSAAVREARRILREVGR